MRLKLYGEWVEFPQQDDLTLGELELLDGSDAGDGAFVVRAALIMARRGGKPDATLDDIRALKAIEVEVEDDDAADDADPPTIPAEPGTPPS